MNYRTRAFLIVFAAATLYWLVTCSLISRDDTAQRIAEANAKIARACTPELGEERLIRWTMGAEGHYQLYVTIRQPIGRKGNVAQFVIVSEDEIQ